jgi:hypothetical protein
MKIRLVMILSVCTMLQAFSAHAQMPALSDSSGFQPPGPTQHFPGVAEGKWYWYQDGQGARDEQRQAVTNAQQHRPDNSMDIPAASWDQTSVQVTGRCEMGPYPVLRAIDPVRVTAQFLIKCTPGSLVHVRVYGTGYITSYQHRDRVQYVFDSDIMDVMGTGIWERVEIWGHVLDQGRNGALDSTYSDYLRPELRY